nr:uncharacterized protein LOC109168299 [Ipomoea batatas]
MSSNRHWMYTRIRNGLLTEEFLAGLETFIQFATSQHSWIDGEKIKCPCNQRKCQNTKFLDVPTVKFHLAKYGFVSDYYVWRFHGEANLRVDVDQDVGAPSQIASEEASNAYHTMVMDAAGPEFNVDEIEELPNPEAQKFYDMLKAADQELWPGSKKHSQLSVVARLMSLKSENHISEKCFNQFTELMKEVAPEDNLVPKNFYETKKLLRGMGYLRKLKNNVKNKAKVEGSISNAYLVEEASSFCSYYFEDHVSTKHRNVPRNADSSEYVVDEHEETLSIFKYPGRAFGKSKARYMTDEEFKAAQTYVLLNCLEVEPFIEVYTEELKRSQPNISSTTIDGKLENEFANWFNDYAHDPSNNISNKFIKDLAKGPLRCVNTYSGIYPEGYTWKKIPNEYKESYFEEFKKFYKWDASIDRHVRKAFLAQAGIRYIDMVSKFKSNRTSTGKPACIHEDTWHIWEAYWDRPDVKAKSEQQRKNRMSEVAGPGTGCSRHTGGSRSAIEHYHKLRDELQKEPNLFECFEHMHKKKNGAFVDERSKKIVEEIQARHDAAT